MAAKVPIRTVFDGSTATGLAEFQSSEFIALAHGGLGASLSLGTANQILKVNSGATALEFGDAAAVAADDVAAGDAAINITTTSGNITIDAAANDTDIILKGTDGGVDTTFLTIDGSAAGAATFNSTITTTGIIIGSTAVTSTATELNFLDGSTANSVVNSKAVIYGSSGELAGTLSTAAQTNVTSVGTLTALQIDNININLNTISSTAGTDLLITPVAGQQIVLDGTIVIDAGVVTGATSITSTAFVGDITGDVTGNTSGTAATVTTAAQSNITSLGTLTTLTVDDVTIDGKVVTMTGSASDTVVITAGTNGTLSIVTTDAAAAAANIQITADGTVDIDSAGVLTLDSGAAINIEPAIGSSILLDGTISIDAGVVTGATSITSTAFVGDITGDVTGNADTATTLATARTIGGTSFNGSANIAVALADTATALATARTIGGTSFDGTSNIAVGLATLATTATVTDSIANTNFPVVFNNESNGLLDDTGALRYNPSTGTLLVPNLVVAGTTSTVDTVTMEAANAIIFEGATADVHETTLTIVDPTADRTINLPNQSGTVPVLAAASNTAVTSTPEELNILDGATVVVGEINALDLGSTAIGTAIASKAVILDSSKDYTGIRNLTITGESIATGFTGTLDGILGSGTPAAATVSSLTSGGAVLSDTDSTDSIGSTGVRWLKGWFDTLTAGTLTIGSGSIIDSSGTINFGNENLTTTGVLTGVGTSITGTASSFTASNVTTNANLTGHITSTGNAAVLGSFTSAQLATALTNETGSGVLVFNTSPTLVTPVLGTPSSGTLTNCTFPTLNQNTSGTAAGLSATLAVASGGTGATSMTAAGVVIGAGTGAVTSVAPSTSGNVLTSNGSSWSSAPAGGGFPSGTVMVFHQTAAPTGWTKNTTAAINDGALRTTTGTVGTGGTVAFETAFASQAVGGTNGTSGATTISTAQMPAHTHTHTRSSLSKTGNAGGGNRSGEATTGTTSSTGGGGSHTHTGSTFTGTAINMDVKFYDVIIASKD
jgi:hypothetical protein